MVEHDQSIVNDETRLVGELGLARWLAAGLVLPFRVFDTHIRYIDPATGATVPIENPELHHRNEVLTGLGDPWLLARAAVVAAGATVSLRVGTTIPLGSTVPDPFALGDMGIPHEHTQFGTGTFDPVIGIDGFRAFGSVSVEAYALTVQSLYENSHGYRAGNRYAVGLGAATNAGTKDWRFRATVERSSETAESWHGTVYTSEGNIGRVDVLAGVETTYRIDEDWHAALGVKVPVYTHVSGGQIDLPLYATLTIGTHVHAWTPAHALPHEAPIAGKITVVDYWATWCKPCHELDGELAELARRHPELEIKKVDVSDSTDFDLPHVQLYGRDGALVWERSGSPAALASAVGEALGEHEAPVAIDPDAVQVAITVTDDGFVPAAVTIPVGRPAVLVFTRKSEKTCAVDVHFTLPDGSRVDRQLPLNVPVAIPLRVDRAAEIPYRCGMDMNHGTITVK